MEAIIITKEDLDSFRIEIIQEISKLVKEVPSKEMSPWLRSRDVCKLLNLSASSLQNLRNSGQIQPKRLNGTLLYRREDIESMLENPKEDKK